MPLPKHGTVRRYKAGCRCSPCTDANTDANRRYRENRRKREGKAEPRTSKPKPVPATSSDPARKGSGRTSADLSTADIDRALDGMEEQLKAGAIETAARAALSGEAPPVVLLRRELVFRGARSLDDPANARYFASTTTAVLAVLESLAKIAPEASEEAKAVAALMETLGTGRRARGRAAVDDAAQSGAGDDR